MSIIRQTTADLAPAREFTVKPVAPEKLANGVVVRSPNWLGDAVMTLPALHALRQMLPESSNIVKFQKLGIHYPVDEPADTVFRIFGSQDPFQIKNPTTLQRNAADFLKHHGVFREEGLFIPRRQIEKVNFDLEKLLDNLA